MLNLQQEADGFATTLAVQRQRLVHHAKDVMLSPESAKPDAVDNLTHAFLTAVELIKSAEEQVADLQAVVARARADEERSQLLFDAAPVALLVTTLDTTIRAANREAARLLGRNADHLLGRDLTGMLPSDQRRGFREQLAQVISLGETSRWSFRLGRANDVPFVAQAAVRLIEDPATAQRALYWSLGPA